MFTFKNIKLTDLGFFTLQILLGVAVGHAFGALKKRVKAPKKIKVTYFDIAGVAEKLRLALVLKGIEFEDDRFKFTEWPTMKPKTKFGVVPEVSFDGQVFGQSDACLRYIASLPGTLTLIPSDPLEVLKLDEVLGVAGDLDRAWMAPLYAGMRPTQFGYPENYQKTEEGKALVKTLRDKFLEERMPEFMEFYEGFLGDNKFICGDEITIADCVILPQLAKFSAGFIDHVPSDTLNKYPKIVAYLERIRAVPAIKAWYST